MTNYELSPALFSDAETVVREGKIFEVGEYPDKDFTLTAAEALEAVQGFTPAPVDYQHVSGPLDGKLGHLESVTTDGKSLFGRVRLPKWLDALLPEKKVSCSWDRKAKRITKLALVTTPRVPDAALFAAFAEADPDGAAAVFEGKGHFISVDGHAVYIADRAVDKGHIKAAAEKHGLSAESHAALNRAHDEGKIQTDEHLYKTIAHAKKAMAGHPDAEGQATDTPMPEGEAVAKALNQHATGDPVDAIAAHEREEKRREEERRTTVRPGDHISVTRDWSMNPGVSSPKRETRVVRVLTAQPHENGGQLARIEHVDAKGRGRTSYLNTKTDKWAHTHLHAPIPQFSHDTDPARAKGRAMTAPGQKPMNPIKSLRALFGLAGVSEDEIEANLPESSAEALFAQSDSAKFAEMQSEVAALRAEAEALRRRESERTAAGFADALLAGGKILPYEKPLVEAQFAQALADDAKIGGTVQFSALGDGGQAEAKTGSRVDALSALFAARPPHGLTVELSGSGRDVTAADLTALFARRGAGETPEEKKARHDVEVEAERKAHGLPARN